ncbi:hypothetical protein RHDC4_01965 [Rhodocyclaceae bacterium]|nr:hypothetical protein RHDC4_01965 [Rhodocyclaceae bacterium]
MPLARALFFLLVLVNLVLFAWGQGYFGTRSEGREPLRLQEQLNPEKLKIGQGAATPQPPARQACLRVEGLAQAEAEGLQKALQEGGGGVAAIVTAAEESSYRVSIGPLPNKAMADKKAGELKQLGIADFQVASGEAGAFSIHLGTSSSEAGANDLLQKLGKKGVRSAHVDALAGAPATASLEARGAEDVLHKRLAALLGTSAATVVDCK